MGQVYVICLLIGRTEKGTTSLMWHSCQIRITHLAWPVGPGWGNWYGGILRAGTSQSWKVSTTRVIPRHRKVLHSSAPSSIASATLKAHAQTALRRLQGPRLPRNSEAKGGVSGGRRLEGLLGPHRIRQVFGGRRGEP